MGTCIYCHRSAGLFSSKHKECELKHQDSIDAINSLVSSEISKDSPDYKALKEAIDTAATDGYLSDGEKKKAIELGFSSAVDKALDDGLLSRNEEDSIILFCNSLGLDSTDLNSGGAYSKVVMAGTLRDLAEGKKPTRYSIGDLQLPFNVKSDETVLWIFSNVGYYKQTTKTTYQGASSGVSFTIVKGVHYRIGQFKGTPVQTTSMNFIASGILAFTTQNIFFCSEAKNLKISYSNIAFTTKYSDGIGIQEGKSSSVPIIFNGIDGWFVYNVIHQLTK